MLGACFMEIPLAGPCYRNYNGTTKVPVVAACAAVLASYKTDTYIVQSYSGYMNV